MQTELTGDQPAALLEEVSKAYGSVQALEDVTFRVPRGALVGVIGPSGAGKTTAIALLTGNAVPTSGTVRTLDADPVRLPRATRQRIGLMPQEFTLFRDLSAQENVDFSASLFGLTLGERRRRTREVLELLTMALGPKSILVAARIDLVDDVDADRVEKLSNEIEEELRDAEPDVDQVFLDATPGRARSTESQRPREAPSPRAARG